MAGNKALTSTLWRRSASVTGQVEPWIERVVRAYAVKGELKSIELQEVAGIRHRETFQRNYLDHLLSEGFIERTIPDKLKSRLQKYRLSHKGKLLLEHLSKIEK